MPILVPGACGRDPRVLDGSDAGEVPLVDRRLKDEFLDELGGQAYDLLQLWEDRILTK